LSGFKKLSNVLTVVMILVLASTLYLLYLKDKSEQSLQEKINRVFQGQLYQVGECFSVELDDSAYARCMATVYAASSIPDSITTFKKIEGVTYGFVMNQFYQSMLISKNKSAIVDNQGQLFDLFMRLSKDPEDMKLFEQLKDFVGSLED